MRLLLKHKIVFKGVPSSGTRVDPEWIKECEQEKAIWTWSAKKIVLQTELWQSLEVW